MLNRWIAPNNPILAQQLRAYRARTPRWLQRANGVIPLMLAVIIVVIFLREIPFFQRNTNFWQFDVLYRWKIQIVLLISFLITVMRYIEAGVAVARQFRQTNIDSTLLTGITDGKVLVGLWLSGLQRVGAWMFALGFMRMIIVLLWLAPNWLEQPVFFWGFGLTAIAMVMVFATMEAIASVGLGVACGILIRNPILATLIAFVARITPTIVFSFSPTFFSLNPYDIITFAIRSKFSTWMSFADGGMTALLRISLLDLNRELSSVNRVNELSLDSVSRLLFCHLTYIAFAFVAAFSLLAAYGIGAGLFSIYRLRHMGVSETPRINWRAYAPPAYSPLLPFIVYAGAAIILCVIWILTPRVIPNYPYNPPYYNLDFMRIFQALLACALAIAALPALDAGVQTARRWRIVHERAEMSWLAGLRLGWTITARLRGWFFWLSLLLIAAVGLLVMEHLINLHTSGLYTCLTPTYIYYRTFGCYAPYNPWMLSHWVIAMSIAIGMSFSIVYTSALIGLGVGLIWHKRAIAFLIALGGRALLPALGLLTPNTFSVSVHGLLEARLGQDPFFAFTDGGLTALVGILDVPWIINNTNGLVLLNLWVSLMFSAGWVMLCLNAHRVWRAWQRRGRKRADTRRTTVSG